MESTTGRTLVASGPAEIEVDFGDSATKTGGRVVKGSGKLDQLLEELEEELLTSDMAQSAVEEVIQTLKATLIGSRISTTKKIEVVVEEASETLCCVCSNRATGTSTRPWAPSSRRTHRSSSWWWASTAQARPRPRPRWPTDYLKADTVWF
ncbi:MAG: hypothetical protein Ct9H300mP30_4170 [Methanobacteriota archaeon]|nr:MAG: hypothetical protein Ct9H300mP30_4170 [Euryarchaeota archaeon]